MPSPCNPPVVFSYTYNGSFGRFEGGDPHRRSDLSRLPVGARVLFCLRISVGMITQIGLE